MRNKMAGFVRSRWMKKKREKRKSSRVQSTGKKEESKTESLKISVAKKDPRGKKQHLSFYL